MANQKLGAFDKKLENISRMEKLVVECIERVDKLEQIVLSLTKTVDELDNRGRRSTLIIYSIKEQETETPKNLLDAVEKRIFEDKLEITTAGIERIHRLGRKQGSDDSKHRLILQLIDYRDKAIILSNCAKQKETGYSIGEDFTRAVREVRKNFGNEGKKTVIKKTRCT